MSPAETKQRLRECRLTVVEVAAKLDKLYAMFSTADAARPDSKALYRVGVALGAMERSIPEKS